MNWNLRNTFLIPTTLIIVIGTALSNFVSFSTSERYIEDSTNQKLAELSIAVNQVETWMRERKLDMSTWRQQNVFIKSLENSFIAGAAKKSNNKLLRQWQDDYGYYNGIHLVDKDFKILASSIAEEDRVENMYDVELLKKALMGETIVSNVYESVLTGKAAIEIVSPVINKQQTVVGLLVGEIDFTYVSKTFISPIRIGKTSYAFLMDKNGLVLSHPKSEWVLKENLGDTEYGEFMLNAKDQISRFMIDKEDHLLSHAKFHDFPWVFGVTVTTRELREPSVEVGKVNTVGALTVIIIVTTAIFFLSKAVAMPITLIARELNDIAKGGDISQHISINFRGEVGQLATSFNQLMDNLSERTNDLSSMMQNMHQGLITVTHDGTIHKEYSSYIERIFNTDQVAGTLYKDLLFANAELGSDTLDQICTAVDSLLGADEMMFEFNKHLLVSDYQVKIPSNIEGQEPTLKILEVEWDPIILDDEIDKIMVTVRDVTSLRAMQAEAEKQKEDLEILGQILKLPMAKFLKFIDSAKSLLDKNEKLICGTMSKDVKVVAELFVNMHTLKGNARTYHFDRITDIVHEAETTYDRLRKEEDYPWDEEQLLSELRAVKAAIARYEDVKDEKLSNTDSVNIPPDSVLLERSQYSQLLEATKAIPSQENVGLVKMIRLLDTTPLNKVLESLFDSLASIAKQLEKEPPQIVLDIEGVGICSEYIDLFNNVFTHLLRNSVDHGIEKPSLREQKGKQAQGSVYLSAERTAEGLDLWLWDDGQGLNIKRLREKAIETNTLSAEEAKDPIKVANNLFSSGVSTAEEVTDISGRGVGMDAVKKYLKDFDCDIEVVLEQDADLSAEMIPFRMRVSLAPSIFELSDMAKSA